MKCTNPLFLSVLSIPVVFMQLSTPALAQPTPEAEAPVEIKPEEASEASPDQAALETTPPEAPTATTSIAPSSEEPAAESAPTETEPAAELAPPETELPTAPEAPPGPEFLPLRVHGSFWSRYELREGYQEHGLPHPRLHREGDYIVSRARLGFSTNPVDVGEGTFVSASFVPQAAYTMATTGAPVTVGDTPPVSLYEGYARVGSSNYRLDVGRFMMDYGDALIIGNLDWNEVARGFTGARLRLTPGETPFYIDAFATLISEGWAQTLEPISGDTYFYGIYAGLGPLVSEGMDLDLYLLGQTLGSFEIADPTDPTLTLARESASEFTLGVRAKDKIDIVDYRVEAGLQFGKVTAEPVTAAPAPAAVDKSALQIDGDLGVTPLDGLRLFAGGFYASGNDPATADVNEGWNDLYPTGHKWLGLSDVTGPRSNIAGVRAGLNYKGLEKVILAGDWHYFTRPELDATGVDGAMGSELNFHAIYPIGKGAVLRAMYAVFLPTEDFWAPKMVPNTGAEPTDSIHYLEIQFGYDFK